jgi:hypothetical protein
MPCYDDRNDRNYILAEEARDCSHNSPAAQHLCTVLRKMEVQHPEDYVRLDIDILNWHKEHKACDRLEKWLAYRTQAEVAEVKRQVEVEVRRLAASRSNKKRNPK